MESKTEYSSFKCPQCGETMLPGYAGITGTSLNDYLYFRTDDLIIEERIFDYTKKLKSFICTTCGITIIKNNEEHKMPVPV